MQPMSRSILAASICAAFCLSPFAFADDNANRPQMPPDGLCVVSDKSLDEQQQLPIFIEADAAKAYGQNQVTYQGNVDVKQGNKNLKANSITVNQSQDHVTANGDVFFYDGQFQSISTDVNSDLKGNRTELKNTQYRMLCQPARGEAAYILKDGQKVYRMEDGSLTSCPDGNKSWRVKASAIDVDNEKEEATLHHTRFEILDTPVFYWPYITVPVGDKRKTGFLYPSFGYDTNDGYELNVPIYFNLAPNFDLETTVNVYQHRGVQLENEFRYLTKNFGEGSIQFDYLPGDRDYDHEDRWGFNFTHEGIYDENWKFDFDYSKVSDDDYFDDLSSSIGNREDGQLLQSGEIDYRTENSTTSLKVRDFQILTGSEPYRLLPQVGYKYYGQELLGPLDFEFDSHVSRFETDDDDRPDATRLFIEPGVVLPLSTTWGELTTEAKVNYSYYDQDLKDISDNDLEETVNRVIPEVRVNGKLKLDRDTTWIDGYTQTLEPQLQYLYVDDVDQSDIFAGYDTTLLQTDYYGLFRDRKFSSVDYIAPANQFSYGLTSRFYDDEYKEKFNISVGQIIYLNNNVSKFADDNDDIERSDLSAIALDTEFNLNESWLFHGDLQYDTDLSDIQIASSTLEYHMPRGYAQLNYRYVTRDYIQSNAPDISDSQLDRYTDDGISQLGMATKLNLNKNWSLDASYYHDTNENMMLEGLAGITYTDDCWAFSVTYTRHIEEPDNPGYTSADFGDDYESNVSFNVGLRGFGTNTMIKGENDDNAISLARPFSLNY